MFVGTNSLGDVNALYNADGDLIVRYEYDAWGKVIAETDANGNALTGAAATWSQLNPFRYRGYYYDAETGLYYLQSRYYDPEVGRFISSDGQIAGVGGEPLGYNTYAYCQNNPVNMTDEGGNWSKWIETAAKVVSVVVAVAAVAVMATTVAGVAAGTIVGAAAGKAVFAASVFLGASLSGINGGVANEANGNSYANGYAGGFASGTIQSVASKYTGGTIWGGSLGTGLGTAMTMGLNNIDPDSSNSTLKEIVKNSSNSAFKATFTSSLTALMNSGIGGVDVNTGKIYGGIADQCGGLFPGATLGFGETLKAFFSAVDDAMVYIMG